MARKKRKSIPHRLWVKLLKEVNSRCPCCGNGDFDHFEVHHIDGNTQNNDFSNLIHLCRICHSKVTKGDITLEYIKELKGKLTSKIPKNKPFKKVEIEAEFPGGKTAFHTFLKNNLKYPKNAVDRDIQGTVIVQFVVDENGVLGNIEPVSGPPELRSEAVRVIKDSSRWYPAKQNDHFVKSHKKQPIIFTLERQTSFLEKLITSAFSPSER